MTYWYTPLVGFILFILGFICLYKADTWIFQLVEMWPWEFGMFEIKFMKIMWRIVSLLFIGFGVYLLVKWR